VHRHQGELCICTLINKKLKTRVCICVYMYVCTLINACVYTCLYVCMYAYQQKTKTACVYMCLYVCMYAYQCVCVYAYIYAYQRRLQPEAHRRRGEVLLGFCPYQKVKNACASICVCRYADQKIKTCSASS